MLDKLILAIDQGTTNTRAIVFTPDGKIRTKSQREFKQYYPHNGWVEHDPEEIWETTLTVCREVIEACDAPVTAIGITNQRETTVVWDKQSGRAIYNAIVWQDRRTAKRCIELRDAGHEELVTTKTGLLLDPYFSATKIAWILDEVVGARDKAESGQLLFGTIDSFLIWRLTKGRVHATDITNASRTMLFNIHTQEWDIELLNLFNVPSKLLPHVRECADDYGCTNLFDNEIPICGVAGDQQAAAIGQACFTAGMVKSTYGTGCFALLNTGENAIASNNRLLTTICYRIAGETAYALEGSIFIAGAAVQWLRDGLQIIDSAIEIESLANQHESNNGVYLVPAFTGLGAPYWNPNARAAVFGMTRDTSKADFGRATLESVCYQTYDLIEAMKNDGASLNSVRVDGGMVANDWVCQFLANVIELPVERPVVTETTALGVAFLAAFKFGVFGSIEEIAEQWRSDKVFKPSLDSATRKDLLNHWQYAVQAVQKFAETNNKL